MFDGSLTGNNRFVDRWGTLSQFHGGVNRHGNLPIRPQQNVTPGLQNQAIKMGYGVQFSVQTLGDHEPTETNSS